MMATGVVKGTLSAAALAVCFAGIQKPALQSCAADPLDAGGLAALARGAESARPLSAAPTLSPDRRAEVAERYGRLPLTFEANQGQSDSQVAFVARGAGYTLFLTHTTEAVLSLRSGRPARPAADDRRRATDAAEAPPAVLRMKVVGGNAASKGTGLDPQPGKANYFIGDDPSRWRTGISRFGRVRYEQVYPGIDLVYYGNQGQLEFDFVVHPGADPGRIALEFEGTQRIETSRDGDLVLRFPEGLVRQRKPVVFQERDGRRTDVAGRYVVEGNRVAFSLGSHDAARPLVIDPVLVYSTYLGGTDVDFPEGVATDNAGCAYVAGDTSSTDFPMAGAFQPEYTGGFYNAFVTKLNASGTAVVYSTYLGGSEGAAGKHVAVDGSGNVYVTGITDSMDFPAVGSLQTATGGGRDGFVSVLDPTGSALVYSTYLGGSSSDYAETIAVDSAGGAYVAGVTFSADFPTVSPLQGTLRGYNDAFVTKIDPSGSAFEYSTYLGGSLYDYGAGVAADAEGNAYVAGYTYSTDFPTSNPLQPSQGGIASYDVFVTKLNPAGSALVYSTYLGGSSGDYARGIAVDAAGGAYVTGETNSTNFPTKDPLQRFRSVSPDGFVAKLSAAGSALVYSTYLGGSHLDQPYDIAVDAVGQACVSGYTRSTDFPVVDAIQAKKAPGTDVFRDPNADAFVAKLNALGSALVFSTYLGGTGTDQAHAVAADAFGNVYVVGVSESEDFPTKRPLQARKRGIGDGFVARISRPYLIDNVALPEGDAGTREVVFNVTLPQAASVEARLDYVTADGTARAGSDYAPTAGTLTFPPGETVRTITVVVNGDTAVEASETFFVSMSSPDGTLVGAARGTGRIVNDDPTPLLQLSATTYVGSEAVGQAVIVVRRSGATQPEVAVDYAASPGTASTPQDFAAVSGTLTFAAGQTSRTFTVPIVNDTHFDPGETVTLTLSNPDGGAALGPRSTAMLTIVDNDPAGSLAFSATSYAVPESGPEATITVRRTGGLASGVTVDYATADGTARAGADYTGVSGTLSFGAGQTTATFTVPVLEDVLGENNETVLLSLSNPTGGATPGTVKTATLTIQENERVLQFAAGTYKVAESGPQVVVTVKRSALLAGSATVEYVTSDGTARAGVDYQARSGVLSFGPNVVSKTFVLPIVNDTLDETDETILVRLRNPVGGVFGPLDAASVTITDNDAGGALQLGAASYSLAENRGAVTVTVVRSGGIASNVTVNYATSDGTATAGSDYTAAAGTLTFGAGVARLAFVVAVTDDADAEGNETVNLALSKPTGGATLGVRSSGVLTILDNEAALEFLTPALTVNEGGVAALTVRRTGSPAGAVSVHYQTADGTAVSGTDYLAASGTLSFASGVVTKTLQVRTVADTLSEADKTLMVTLDTPAGAALGVTASAVVTIKDNDPAGVVQLGAASYTVAEKVLSATVTVTRTGGTASEVTVGYQTSDDTATAGDDYAAAAGTLTFAAAKTSGTFTVPILPDVVAEGAETVTLSLGPVGGGATLGARSAGVLTIMDDDAPQFQFGVVAYRAAETVAQATITVKRVGVLTQTATVDYATSDETAVAGEDYASAWGTLSFAVGVATKTFAVPLINDTADETDETLALTLSSPSAGHQLGSPRVATLTITDNDLAGTVQLGAPVFSDVEPADGETTLATVTVTRAGGTSSAATVDYATSDGTATGGSDYTATSGTLTFGVGQTSASFTVELLGDAEEEGNESVTLTLSSPGGGVALGAQSTATLWIVEPAGAAKLVFIHHSTGESWLSDTHGQLGMTLRDNNYFVSDTNYGWGPAYEGGSDTIGDHTDIGEWWSWFRGASSATYLSALYEEFGQHASYSRLVDPDAERENEIVMFKSCFPNSALGGNPADPATTEPNALRGQDASSTEMNVSNAKGIYNDLLVYFAAHPEKLFIVVTAPPLVTSQTTPAQAANARAFNDWLVNDWLTGYAQTNVAVFDFYNVLTSNGGTAAVNDLGKETGNHHRWWNGAEQHVHPVAAEVSAYATSVSDSHPTAAGGRKASGEIVALLNLAYNRWKGIVPSANPTLVSGASAKEPSRRKLLPAECVPEAIAPPGRR